MICVNQIYWTAEVHEAIRSGPQGVKEYHEKLMSQVRGEGRKKGGKRRREGGEKVGEEEGGG